MDEPFIFPQEPRVRWPMDNFRKIQDGDSTPRPLHRRVFTAITSFFTEIWDRVFIFFTATFICVSGLLILFLHFIFGLLFIIPLTPAFTLQSISTSASSILVENSTTAITTNFTVHLHVENSNPIGSNIYSDDSLHASIFHRQENISTFFLPPQQEQRKQSTAAAAIEALFSNVSLVVDEWASVMDHGLAPPSSSCGYVYLDLWFNSTARFTPFVVNVKDKLQGHCGGVKVQLCSSSSSSSSGTAATTVVQPFLAACEVHSDVVYRIRLILFLMLIFLLVTTMLTQGLLILAD